VFYNRPLENRRPFVQIVNGKCHAGLPEFELIDAELNGLYYDDKGSRQTLTQLKAIALELRLAVDQFDELVAQKSNRTPRATAFAMAIPRTSSIANIPLITSQPCSARKIRLALTNATEPYFEECPKHVRPKTFGRLELRT
jgi:hypothetical protein